MSLKDLSPYQLGATLYMPATRTDLLDIILHDNIYDLRSMVICLEDAVREDQVVLALANLRHSLGQLEGVVRNGYPLLFIRPRHPQMAMDLLQWANIGAVEGFVLPKFDNDSFAVWCRVIENSPAHFMFMPTLETTEILQPLKVSELCSRLQSNHLKKRILVLRIGGHDLLSCLHLRSSHTHTLYDGPLGYIIAMLVSHFAPAGFHLTAPVFNYFRDHRLLHEEFRRDLLHGLVGKSVIHPTQIPIIHQALKVEPSDYEAAKRILEPDTPAVFQLDGAMYEPATHRQWAWRILERVKYFGCHLHSIPEAMDFAGTHLQE